MSSFKARWIKLSVMTTQHKTGITRLDQQSCLGLIARQWLKGFGNDSPKSSMMALSSFLLLLLHIISPFTSNICLFCFYSMLKRTMKRMRERAKGTGHLCSPLGLMALTLEHDSASVFSYSAAVVSFICTSSSSPSSDKSCQWLH